jgi:opacity protein-like surface antigen
VKASDAPIAVPDTWTGFTIGINGGWSGGKPQDVALSTNDPPGTLGPSALPDPITSASSSFPYTNTAQFSGLSSINGLCHEPSICYAGANNLTATGWTAGGGLEYLLANNWILRAEYLYISLNGANRVDEVVVERQTGSAPPSTVTANVSGFAFQTVRAAPHLQILEAPV